VRKTNFYLVAILIIGLAAAAAADVVIKTKSTMNTMGFMSADVTGTEYVRADRNATESTTKMTGGMMAMMGGDKASIKTASINRLDKGLIWELNAKEMTYSEKPLASLKTDYEEEGEQGQDDMLGEADKYDWTIDVKTEDTPVDISGFKCKGIIATAKGVSKEDPTEKTDLVFEYWYAKDVDGYSELKEYRKNFAAATGLDIVQSQKDAGEIFTRFGDEFKDMFARMEKAEGYPIKTVITVKGSKKMMMQGEADEGMDEKNMPAGMAEMMKGMMGGQEKSEDGMATLLSITSVVESIMKQPVDDSQYEIPEGYSKEDR
jgi:hypothetical protein